MMLVRALTTTLLLSLVAGCATIEQHMENNISAAPLAGKPEEWLTAATAKGKREELALLVYDSQLKCNEFLHRLTFQMQTINATGDIATTVFSALGSVFTPINTVHGLTAASTISSGTKASLMADIYAKASVANFQTAIQQTYSVHIAEYIDKIPTLDEQATVFLAEVNKIQSIHALCGLAQAESTIAAQLTPTGTAQTSAITLKKQFTPSTVAEGGKSTLTLSLGNSSGTDAALTASLTDNLPDGLVVASPNGLKGTCQAASVVAVAGTGTVTYRSGASVPASGCTISIDVSAGKAGSYANKIASGALQTNQGASGADAQATLTVSPKSTSGQGAASSSSPSSAIPPSPNAPSTKAATWGTRLQ